MQARDDAAVWQHARQFRQVRPLREEMGVVPRGRKVERSTYANAALAAIAIVLNGIYVPGEGLSSNMGTDRNAFNTNGQSFSSHIEELCEFSKFISPSLAGPTKRSSAIRDTEEAEELSDESSVYEWELLNK